MTLMWPIVIVLIVLAILAKNPKLLGRFKTGAGGTGLDDIRVLIAFGIIVFDLVSWAMIPWWWGVLSYTWYGFVFFNIGLWTVLYLGTIKIKDATGKDTKENNPTASKLAKFIAILLVVGLLTTAWHKFEKSDLAKTITKASTETKNPPAQGILLGVVDVPTDKWSKEVKNPTLGKVCWGRVDVAKGGSCQVRFDKDPKKIFPIKGDYTRLNPETIEFKCPKAGARVKVESKL